MADFQPHPEQEFPSMPAAGTRAAEILIDAIVAQRFIGDVEADTRACQLALSPLVNPRDELDESITDEHLVGAALINQGWLASRLASARGVEIETVMGELRDFVLSVPN